MTGFGAKQYKGKDIYCEWTIKSVNQRSLHIDFHMPFYLQSIEFLLRKLIEKHIERGKIECHLRLQKFNEFSTEGIREQIQNVE